MSKSIITSVAVYVIVEDETGFPKSVYTSQETAEDALYTVFSVVTHSIRVLFIEAIIDTYGLRVSVPVTSF